MMNRRRVLRGLAATGGAVVIPLPTFDAMLNGKGTAYAATGAPLRRRYMTWFFGNGVLPKRWVPAATGTDNSWQLSDELAPLAQFKDYLTVVTGMVRRTPGFAHSGIIGSTTGAVPDDPKQFYNDVLGPSIDQIVANVIGGDGGAQFRSLEIGVAPRQGTAGNGLDGCMCWRGPGAPLEPEYDPAVVFQRVFSKIDSGSGQLDLQRLATANRSVLDAVLADGAQLRGSLGAEDQKRLDSHLDGIRALEKRIMSMSATSNPACPKPAAPTVGRDLRNEAPSALNEVMGDMAVLALACGLTNVMTFMFSRMGAPLYMRFLAGLDDNFHDTICHNDPGDEGGQTRVHTGVLYQMGCLASLMGKVKARTEGAGNLLDNTLVYVLNELGWGKEHTWFELPALFIGRAGIGLRTNQHIRFQDGNVSSALFSIANIMGANVTEIGVANGRVTRGIPGFG